MDEFGIATAKSFANHQPEGPSGGGRLSDTSKLVGFASAKSFVNHQPEGSFGGHN